MDAALFFIAVIPDPTLRTEITQFKEYAAEHFGTSRALRSPPHITLFPPFKWPPRRLEELLALLEGVAGSEKDFFLSLSGFDCFAPRVIFVKVGGSPSLKRLQGRLVESLATGIGLRTRDSRPYHPHLTVAFKDLRASVFPEAWAHFSPIDYKRTFRVDSLSLLKHNGRVWEIFQDFAFAG